MSMLQKVLLSFFSLLFFVFLLFFTFFGASSSFEVLQERQDGVYRLDTEKDTVQISYERYETINALYFLTGSKYEKKSNNETDEIFFGSGQFFVDLGETAKSSLFSGNGFRLEVYGGGKFFLSFDESKNELEIVSQTALLDISLLNTDTKNKMTNLILYPHMGFYGRMQRNNFLENADHLRLMSVQTVDYKDYSFFDSDEQLLLFSSLRIFDKTFFLSILEHQSLLRRSALSGLSKVFTIFSGFRFPGESYIEKYKVLFLNDTKKSSYLSYKIETGLIRLASNPSDENLKKDIEGFLSELSTFDPEGYKNTLKNIKQFHLLLIESADVKYIPLRKYILETLSKHKTEKPIDTYLLLSNLYEIYDQGNQKKLFYKEFLPFLKEYLGYLGIRIDTGKIQVDVNLKDKNNSLDYLTLFVEKLLIPKEGDFENISFDDFVKTFEIYEILSSTVYNTQTDVRARTGMYTNLNLLKKTLLIIDTLYFKKERDERGLLVRQGNNALSSETIANLSSTLDKMFSFYFINKKFLSLEEDSNDVRIAQEYEQMKILFEEYLVALRDYEKYSVDYDTLKKNLLDIDTILRNDDQIISEENLKQYLSQFDGFDSFDLKFRLEKNTYFIENVSFGSQKFAFLLNPSNAYEISQITINGVEKNGSYKLGVIQANWEEKIQEVNPEDAWKYEFRNFFSLVFLSGNTTNVSQDLLLIPQEKLEEDKFTRVFKQTKLLGEKTGVLRRIKTLQFDYNDVIATRNQDIYDIRIQDAFFSLQLDDNRYGRYDGILAGNFIFGGQSQDIYFKDLKLKLYSDYERDKEAFLFRGSDIQLIGKILLDSFDETFPRVIGQVGKISTVEEQLHLSYPILKSELKYVLASNKAFLKANLVSGEVVTIVFLNDTIETFSFAGKNLLNRTIPYTEFTNYIP